MLSDERFRLSKGPKSDEATLCRTPFQMLKWKYPAPSLPEGSLKSKHRETFAPAAEAMKSSATGSKNEDLIMEGHRLVLLKGLWVYI